MKILRVLMLLAFIAGFSSVAVAADSTAPADAQPAAATVETTADASAGGDAAGQGAKGGEEPECD